MWAIQFSIVLLLLAGAVVRGSACPDVTDIKDLGAMDDCSKGGKTLTQWGRCMVCSGTCDKLSQFTSTCSLGYGQLLPIVDQQRNCVLNPMICNTGFGALVNITCAAGQKSAASCSPMPLIPVIAGAAGGGLLLLIIVAVVLIKRRRRRARVVQEKATTKRSAKSVCLGPFLSMAGCFKGMCQWQKKCRFPSSPKRTRKAKAKADDRKRDPTSKLLASSGSLSPMASGSPTAALESKSSFRDSPPPKPPKPPLTSQGSSRQKLVVHKSAHGASTGYSYALTAKGSFRDSPDGLSPQLTPKSSFRGPPPLESHPQYAHQPPPLVSHNSFHDAPPVPPRPPGLAPLPPPSRSGAGPAVPPSRVSDLPTAAAAASSVPGRGLIFADLHRQATRGVQ
jgi:hypothetical protein